MALEDLEARIQSGIPTPVARYGYSALPEATRTVVYDGQSLPKFLLDNGVPPMSYRAFLTLNKIARIWDLERGQAVQLPPTNDQQFATHPDA